MKIYLIVGRARYQELVKSEDNHITESCYVLAIHNHPAGYHLVKLTGWFDFNFGFHSDVHKGLTTSEMLKLLKETANKDFFGYDGFLCVIVSYGSKDGIYGRDDKAISLETITSLFSQNKCPSLKGKPKIFLMEAFQRGDKVPGSDSSSSPVVSEGDFLINYATPKEKERPSCFGLMSAVHYVLEVYSAKEDLMNMMTRVNKLTTKSYSASKMQSPTLVSTLTKKVFLKPLRSRRSKFFLFW